MQERDTFIKVTSENMPHDNASGRSCRKVMTLHHLQQQVWGDWKVIDARMHACTQDCRCVCLCSGHIQASASNFCNCGGVMKA